MPHVAVVGGGPAGYEAALVAAQLGADVTVVERDAPGGACVLSDCVPSKTLIATSQSLSGYAAAGALGIRLPDGDRRPVVDVATVGGRVRRLASAQSADVARRLSAEGVRVLAGEARLAAPDTVDVRLADGGRERLRAPVVLLATGGTPRTIPGAAPDGERILSWRQLYDLAALPEELVVVGSGVTGVEFADAYQSMGAHVTLVSSRDRVLPGEDADAARLVERIFAARGMTILSRSRAAEVTRVGEEVRVRLVDGRVVAGSHCLVAVGSVPNTRGLGLAEAGVALDEGGYVRVDRVSRTSVPGVYAAGDCTGVQLLASVAAMQGRIAVWHALGEAVTPLRLSTVAATVFTDPEIATVGATQASVDASGGAQRSVTQPLATNARAKMQGIEAGFVKLFSRAGTGAVVGGVVVAPRASELVLPVAVAVLHGLTVDQLAHSFAVYPSLSGSLTEAARRLMEAAPG